MTSGAPRPVLRVWCGSARGVLRAAVLVATATLWLVPGIARADAADGIVDARYGGETTRYAHAVLGDSTEYGELSLTTQSGRRLRIVLPEHSVFEDLKPRVVDLDGDGAAEVVVVESHRDLGAQLAVYGPQGKIAATPHIGRTNRWLAPVGAADLDGDGLVEIAYVDRPHLAKILRVWRFSDGTLVDVAGLPGLTNHRIGEDFISGGLRDCGAGPEMVLAEGDWTGTVSVTLSDGRLERRSLSEPATPVGFAAALACTEG